MSNQNITYTLQLNDKKMLSELNKLDTQIDELVRSQKQLNKTSAEYTKNKATLKATRQEYGKLQRELVKTSQKTTILNKKTNTFGRALNSFPFKFNLLGNAMAMMGGVGIMTLVDGFKKLMGIVNDFTNAQSKLRSILLVSRKEMQGLTDDAIRLGGARVRR